MRILIVEDDLILAEGLIQGLQSRGFSVDHVGRAGDAEVAIKTQEYAAVILDLGLPDRDGRELIKILRANRVQLPILVLTAKDSIGIRVETLDLGSDDYLIKPFDLNELAARIRALIRRSQGRAAPILKFEDLTLNPASHEVYFKEHSVDLSPKEFAVLEILLENQGKVITREHLEEQLYSWNKEVESNAVEVHIYNIRKKIHDKLIKNIRGVGYIIT
jgi:DNA-binding response OmpR family regulator